MFFAIKFYCSLFKLLIVIHSKDWNVAYACEFGTCDVFLFFFS